MHNSLKALYILVVAPWRRRFLKSQDGLDTTVSQNKLHEARCSSKEGGLGGFRKQAFLSRNLAVDRMNSVRLVNSNYKLVLELH